MEVLIPPIRKGSISRATKDVKNMIEDLQKRSKLIKIADKSPRTTTTARALFRMWKTGSLQKRM